MGNPVEILEQAKQILESERGWYQGDLISCDTGAVCALGAVRLAQGCRVEQEQRKDGQTVYRLVFPYDYLQPSKEQMEVLEKQFPSFSAEWYRAHDELWAAHEEAEVEFDQDAAETDRFLHEATKEYTLDNCEFPSSNVAMFNDRPLTTLTELIEVFDLAIQKAKAATQVTA